ncbi:MAG TPA: extracellular solute-binding protein [Thermoflexus sp.]|nr:extracellular solute-binding protein [Thermoflexus sp.]
MARWLLALGLALSLVACAPAATPAPPTATPAAPPPAATPAPPTPTPPPKEVVLTAWTIGPEQASHYRADNLVAAAEALNAALAAEGANIRVKVDASFDTSTWDEYRQRFLLAAQAGNAPDIILSGHEDVAPWSEAGFIIPLDDLIRKYEAQTGLKDIIPGLWRSVEYKGQRWAIPQDTEARPMYFSKALLKKLGWSEEQINALPEQIKAGQFTLHDMLRLAKEAQDKGIVQPGYGYWPRPRRGLDFYQFYMAFGGQLQDPQTGKLVLDREALLKHFQFHYDTVFTFGTTPKDFIGTEWNVWHETVSTGDQVLFWNGGTWHWAQWLTQFGRQEPDLWEKIGFALIPAGEPGGKPTTLSHPLVYMVTSEKASGKKNQELAFRLIAMATTPDLNTKHAVESAHLAILTTQINHPEYVKAKFLQQTAYMVEYATYAPNHADFSAYDEVVWTALSAVMGGEMKPDQAVDMVVKELQARLGDKVIIR